jgi:hypothetical protein
MNLFSAVEVINGGRTMFSSSKYWDAQLSAGHRLAAVGGSDSHNATSPPGPPGSIGWPSTVVEANELSVPAILNGIREGRTFVDLTASHDKQIDFEADAGDSRARMGEILHTSGETSVHLQIHTVACTGSLIHLILDGEETKTMPPMPVDKGTFLATTALTMGEGRHWLRVEVRDAAGTLQLVSSPIYVNFQH